MNPLSDDTLAQLDGWWRAANYLSVGQIYLLDNPLLRTPLSRDDVKPRLLGHWGTTPGLNFLYAHLNRAIKERAQSTIYVTGPGHGGPGLVANAYLDGTYSEVYSDITPDAEGIRRLFRQFSFPGGIPSHVAPETPGSIHEGGELGYALSHAYGAAFDNPDLLVAAVVGDGEAETGALATSWHSNKFVNPVNDGVVLPILHLNGYKIANPTVLDRIPTDELRSLMVGYGHKPYFFEATTPTTTIADAHRGSPRCSTTVLNEIAEIKARAADGDERRPTWPMIVFRTPKGWTGPAYIDGKKTTGSWRAHQVPLASARDTPEHLQVLADWLASYRADELFDEDGELDPDIAALAPAGDAADERQPARQRRAAAQGPAAARLPRLRRRRPRPRRDDRRVHQGARPVAHRRHPAQPGQLPHLRTRRDRVQPSAVGVRRHRQAVERRVLRPRGRRAPRPRRPRHGDAVGAPVPGLAGGLSADRPARAVQLLRGVHPHHRLDVQPARQMAQGHQPHSVAATDREPELPSVQPCLASGPQRLQPPGPRLHRPRRQQARRGRPGLSAAGRQHAAVHLRPLPAVAPVRQRRGGGQAAAARTS